MGTPSLYLVGQKDGRHLIGSDWCAKWAWPRGPGPCSLTRNPGSWCQFSCILDTTPESEATESPWLV